jgi:hypothetical protein
MKYLKWTESDLEGIHTVKGIVTLFTEVDDLGSVRREVGVDCHGRIVHRFPGEGSELERRGFFDNQTVSIVWGNGKLITAESFKEMWNDRGGTAH